MFSTDGFNTKPLFGNNALESMGVSFLLFLEFFPMINIFYLAVASVPLFFTYKFLFVLGNISQGNNKNKIELFY